MDIELKEVVIVGGVVGTQPTDETWGGRQIASHDTLQLPN